MQPRRRLLAWLQERTPAVAIGAMLRCVITIRMLPLDQSYFPPLAHESFSVSVRLNTGAPGFESTRSATK